MDKGNIIKVFINPNFNKNTKLKNQIVPPQSIMHVNPNFPKYGINLQSNTNIYINPNFINRNQIAGEDFKCTNELINRNWSNNSKLQNEALDSSLCQNKDKTILQHTTTKSRYSIVRQNLNKQECIQSSDDTRTIVKISKYKSVRLNMNNKKALEDHNNIDKKIPCEANRTKHFNKKYYKENSKFKFVKYNTESPKFTMRNSKINKPPMDIKHVVNSSKIKNIKGNLKKNNIPCPLFKKYGKCLRMAHGKCEYMHDKKHVSICRKFLKGICHDKLCLLSHELTLKKMPTCYFYLQGMCTKEGCPYLHVKLNEKTKVCPDFIKGYCEKGDKCLNRHVNLRNKRKLLNVESKYKSNKLKVNKYSDHVTRNRNHVQPGTSNLVPNNVKENSKETDCRYYKDTKVDDKEPEKYDIIKPTRCKLGTLPSFIKF
ncbi:uncharacterized protein LOC131848315 [Achroia grisella]|uniref:uncharacterized protein LOC131848315 n=1 Tax=Achroia grisella TaxID=688607 RepID=UPI0027D2B82E|nr:uncharacterized protein LOC131848315 [Achroia grisella]